MKKVLFILAICMTSKAYSQVIKDSVVKNAIQINPVVVNIQGDTAVQFSWYAFDIQRDSVSGCNTNVILYDRKGSKVFNFNQPIPASVLNQWSVDPKPIDDFIISKNARLVRKPD